MEAIESPHDTFPVGFGTLEGDGGDAAKNTIKVFEVSGLVLAIPGNALTVEGTHAFRVDIIRTEQIVLSLMVVVVKSGRIHSASVLSTT